MKIGFSPDRPIESARQDLLGRSPFASLIAEMISRWRQRECLVIALYGAWGSGKSSVKNLILERLAEEKYKLAPIEFNPWLAPGVEKITETFFTEIGVKLFGETDESDKHRAAKWKRYADYLKIGSYVATVTAPALVEKGIRFLEGKAAGRADSFEKKENSVQQMRKDLREAFQSLNTPIVIVIDDIDRLTEEEINLIFRLVKANADFPVRRRIICESFSAIYEWWRISLCSTIVCCRGLRPKTTVC